MNQEDIQKAINSIEQGIAFLSQNYSEATPIIETEKVILEVLREKAERDKGCEYCNNQKPLEFESGYYGHIGECKPSIKVYDDIAPSIEFNRDGNSTYFDIICCPMCGRDLRKEAE